RRAPGFRDVLGPRGLAALAQHAPEDLKPMPKGPGEILEGALAGGPTRDVSKDPDVGMAVRGLLSKAPERGGGGRDDGNGSEVQWRPGPEGLLRDFARMPDVLEGDDEGRLRAGAEESVQFRDRVPLDQEELDRIGFEQRAALAYERQKLLAHPGPHGRQVHKIPSSASPESPRKLKAMRRIGTACCGFASKHRAVPRRRRRRWAQPFEISFRICRSNSRRTGRRGRRRAWSACGNGSGINESGIRRVVNSSRAAGGTERT